MSHLKTGDEVKYVGTPNRWTYQPDLVKGTIGYVVSSSLNEENKCCQVLLDNYITVTIFNKDLEIVN
jgi:hypothetical protein